MGSILAEGAELSVIRGFPSPPFGCEIPSWGPQEWAIMASDAAV